MTDPTPDVPTLRRLLAGATPVGDWYWTQYGSSGKTLARPGPELGSVFGMTARGHEHNVLKTTDDWPPTDPDAALIVAAVNALPGLLTRLEAAEGAVARVEGLAEGSLRRQSLSYVSALALLAALAEVTQ